MRIRTFRAFRWPLVPTALAYVVGLIVVTNLGFGMSIFSGQGASSPPTRTGVYGGRLPTVAPVDGKEVATAIAEANGGQPTIGLPPPDDSSQGTTTVASTQTVAPISSTTTPTYTGATQVSTISIASLLALIPTSLTFPHPANPHRKH